MVTEEEHAPLLKRSNHNVSHWNRLKKSTMLIRAFIAFSILLLFTGGISMLQRYWKKNNTFDFGDLKGYCSHVQPIQPHEYIIRYKKLAKALKEEDASAFIMEGGATMLYYTNIDWELTERPFMVVLQLNESEPTGIHTTIVTPAFEATRAVKSVKEANLPNEIQPKFVEWLEDRSPFDVLKTILIQPTTTIDDDDDNNNNNRRRKRQQPIIFVEQNVRLFVFQGISDALLTGKVMMAPRFIRMLRMVKSNSELEIMRCANKVTELAIRTVRPHVKIGMTELDIQRLMENALHTAGLTKTWVLALIDENAALPHGSSSMKKVTGHSSVLIDTGGELLGYQSDCTRTFFMGARGYNQTIEDAWYLVRRAQENVLNHTEANMTCAQVDLTARHIIDKAGYGLYFTHRLGHGIGREMHEEPYMNQGNKAQHLVPGITFSVEPGIYVPQEFGIRLEDIVFVREDGKLELLTSGLAQNPWTL